ncbi:MAG: prolyl oligopeptidase family serine peptidase [Bacteroidota bacterium]
MKTIKQFRNLAMITLLLIVSYSVKSQIALEDFFKKPEKSEFLISPDGKYISYLAPSENKMNIFVEEIATGKSENITKEKAFDVDKYYWANDKRIVYLLDKAGDDVLSLYAIDASGKRKKALSEVEGINNIMIDNTTSNPMEIIIGNNSRENAVIDAYKVNVETGEMTMIGQNTGKISKWITDHAGIVRLATESDGVSSSVLIRDNEAAPFRKLVTTDFKESVEPLFFTFDNKNVYALSNIGRDKKALVIIDGATGKEKEVVYENQDYDVKTVYFSEKLQKITSICFVSWKKEKFFFSPEAETIFNKLSADLKTEEINVMDYNAEENKFILKTSSDKSYGSYYFMDIASNEIKKIADASPWLEGKALSNMKAISYKSRDGYTIYGYLTMPNGPDTANLPVVVLPHANLNERDIWGYNSTVQFLASRGYAVFQPNYRGSVGYGKKFQQAGFKQFGLNIQNDITDGVNFLISSGIADKGRVAIMGESFGGNIALCGLSNPPGMYVCGIAQSGICDMTSYLNSIPSFWKSYRSMMFEMIGNPLNDVENLKLASPNQNVANIKVPLLFAQGGRDMMVKKVIVDKFIADIKANNVDVNYIIKFDEGHGFKKEQNIFDYYKAVEQFLAKYMVAPVSGN